MDKKNDHKHKLNLINSGYNDYRMHVYSSCGSLISFPDDVIKKTNIKNVYITELFRKSENFYYDFLKKIKVHYIKEHNKRSHDDNSVRIVCYATGENYIKIISEYDNGIYDYNYYSSSPCRISRDLVNKIFNYKTKNGKDLHKVFPDSFLKLYFELGPEYSWINNDDIILYPDFKRTYFTKSMVDKFKKKHFDNMNDPIELDDIHFEGLIKCDNYDYLVLQYKHKKFDNIRKHMYKSNFRSPILLSSNDKHKMRRIYKSIINYFASFGVLEDNVLIDFPLFNIINKKWLWMFITVKIRDKYKGKYDVRSKPQGIGVIKLLDYINYLKLANGNVSDILDNKHNLYITLKLIKELDIDHLCTNVVKYKSRPEIIKYSPSYTDHPIIENESYEDIVINGKFNNNLKIYNISVYSSTLVSSKCGINVCCSINDKHYIFSILTDTYSYLSYLNIYQGAEYAYNYIINGIKYRNLDYDDGDYRYESSYFDHLKYSIDIKELASPYKCNTCNNVFSTDIVLNEMLLYNKKQTVLEFKANYEIASVLLDYCKKHFEVRLHIIIYNLIRNIIICKHKENRPINDFFVLFEKILDLENIFAITKNIKYKFFSKLFIDYKSESFYNNNGNIFVMNNFDIHTQYLCVLGKEFMDSNKERDFKYLIWFTTPNLHTFSDIVKVVDNICLVFNDSFIKQQTTTRGIHDVPFNKFLFGRIYSLNNEKLNYIIDNYIYNISSLVLQQKNFEKLTSFVFFIDDYMAKRGLIYKSFTYHYLNSFMFQTFHIHVTFKKTVIISSTGTLNSVFNMGVKGNMKNEQNNLFLKDFFKFDPHIWKKYNSIYFIVKCNMKFSQYISNNKHKFYGLYVSTDKKKVIDFTVKLMVKLSANFFIPNLIESFNKGLVFKYFTALLSYKNNYKIFIDFISNFLKYTDYYNHFINL